MKNYFLNIWVAVKTVYKGLSITMNAFLKTNGLKKVRDGYNYGSGDVTISYPDVKDNIPAISRKQTLHA
ncbi:MAG: hypothetical protein R3A80_13220 [Bdellovibrionota bacterium]